MFMLCKPSAKSDLGTNPSSEMLVDRSIPRLGTPNAVRLLIIICNSYLYIDWRLLILKVSQDKWKM